MKERQLAWLVDACSEVIVSHSGTTSFSGFALDSRDVKEGDLFCALSGQTHDGIFFVEKALQAGARGVISSYTLAEVRERYKELGFKQPPSEHTPWIVVKHTWRALGVFAQACYDYPDRELKIIAITGTDGKTSTSYYLYQMLAKLGVKAGLISTVCVDDGSGEQLNTVHVSTPQAPDLFAKLRAMVDAGYSHVVLETTSHALDLGRLGASTVDVAVFTNLGRDHLEHHKTMDNYFAAKKKLFAAIRPSGYGVAMAYCPQYGDLAALAPRMMPAELAVAFENHSFVDENRALAVAAIRALELKDAPSLEQLRAMAETLKHPKGRLQEVKGYEPVRIVIDYCHTPAAYKLLLPMMKKQSEKRLLVLFGSAGERDKGKRYELGAEADLHADEIWLTDEDPRSEASENIFKDIKEGIRRLPSSAVHVIKKRQEAVADILSSARPGDTVLLLGKGHEIDIKYDGYAEPYNEQEVVEAWIAERKNAARYPVGFFYGGASTEHIVSCRSAASMCRVPDPARFELIYIGISLDGKWYLQDAPVMKDAKLLIAENPEREVHIKPGRGLFVGAEALDVAVVFPMLHGTGGEDGVIQGALSVADIAFMGAGLDESALAMNKVLAKRTWQGLGLPVVPSCAFTRQEWEAYGMHIPALMTWTKEHCFPYFVKPARGGSSVGISRACNIGELQEAIELALQFDSLVMIEIGIDHPHELEFAVVGGKVYHPGEIRNTTDFYSYKEKYSNTSSTKTSPRAQVDGDILKRATQLALDAYKGLDLETFARVDLFLDKQGELYINEINTLPGMTSISLFPQIIEGSGDKLTEVFAIWFEQARMRYQSQKDLANRIKHFSEEDPA